jgi:hypothetical protein
MSVPIVNVKIVLAAVILYVVFSIHMVVIVALCGIDCRVVFVYILKVPQQP